MSKVYVVYMCSKGIDDTTNFIGVFDSDDLAQKAADRQCQRIKMDGYKDICGHNHYTLFANDELGNSIELFIKPFELNVDKTLN